MKNLTRVILVAAALVASGSAVMAASQKLPDWSKPYHGLNPNSTEGKRAFWEDQSQKSD